MQVGDKVTVVTPEINVSPAGLIPRIKRFTLIGIYEVGMSEYDRSMGLLHLEDAAKLMWLDDAVTGVRLKLADLATRRRWPGPWPGPGRLLPGVGLDHAAPQLFPAWRWNA